MLEGLAQLMMPDWKLLGSDRYEHTFVKVAFLGPVRCLVYDVAPLPGVTGGFTGRLYIESRTWNIVRFTGTHAAGDALLAPLRKPTSKLRVDAWRKNVGRGIWLPYLAYLEEVAPLGSAAGELVRGQVRFWNFQKIGEHTDVSLNESPTATGAAKAWPTPQESQRIFEDEAEANVLDRLRQAGFLGAGTSEVERMLEQVITNLVVTNKLSLPAPVRLQDSADDAIGGCTGRQHDPGGSHPD